jgi:hypothetical protein
MTESPVTGERLASWPVGPELFAQCAAESGSKAFLLSFSRGKDSICCAIALQEAGYEIIPFFAERIPGLSFVEESLAYYERELFGGRHIIRALHPATAAQMREFVHQPPHYIPVAVCCGMADYTYQDVQSLIIKREKLAPGTLTAVGLRAADSILRRTNIARQGPVNRTKKTFMPIWNWNKADLIGALTRRGIKLPADYALFNRTFDGLMAEFLVPLKRDLPKDYARVLELFPLAEAEVWRYEHAHGGVA